MNDLEQLRREADYEADRFFESYRAIRKVTSPRKLVDNAVHRMDPHFRMLHRIEDKVRRNPLVAIAVLFATAVIAKNTLSDRSAGEKTRNGSANGRLNTRKEMDYGYDQDRS